MARDSVCRSHSASMEAEDNFRWTALHHACHGGHLEIVDILLEAGANINAVCLSGGTPLNRAIESSRVELVQYLLEKGIKLHTENRKGQLHAAGSLNK